MRKTSITFLPLPGLSVRRFVQRLLMLLAFAATEGALGRPKVDESIAPANQLTAATRDAPFVNSLGMKFVPVLVTGGPTSKQNVYFCIHETRVQDFRAFVESEKSFDYDSGQIPRCWTGKEFSEVEGKGWHDPGFDQNENHPVTCVSWEDAHAFIAWLNAQEEGVTYRLPSDHEWSCAVGIGEQEDPNTSPESKNAKIKDAYPWGQARTPPDNVGNYADTAFKAKFGRRAIEGYDDGYAGTAPVMSYEKARTGEGLYDLGGNVLEWCEDKYSGGVLRVLRGGSLGTDFVPALLSSGRNVSNPGGRGIDSGFRLVVMSGADTPDAEAAEKSDAGEEASQATMLTRIFQTPDAAEVDGAAKVGDAFIRLCSEENAAGALALVDPSVLKGDGAAKLSEAIKISSQQTGALKSALLLRGRALRTPLNEEDEVPTLLLCFVCEFEKGISRVSLRFQKSGEAGGTDWKILMHARMPLDRPGYLGWQVWEMSASAALAVSLRAHGAAPADWEPLVAVARRMAKLLKVTIPDLPKLTGKLPADRTAAQTWISITFPKSVRKPVESLHEWNHTFLDYGINSGLLHLRYEKAPAGHPPLVKIIESLAEDFDESEVLSEALASGMEAADFRRLITGLIVHTGENSDNNIKGPPVFKAPLAFGLAKAQEEAIAATDEALQDLRENGSRVAGMLQSPDPADVDGAARAGEAFLAASSAGRTAEALAILDPSLISGDAAAELTAAMKNSNRQTGALKSATHLRGRALRTRADTLPGSEEKAGKFPWLDLYYVGEYEKGLSLIELKLQRAGAGADAAWKVLTLTRLPLEKGRESWEMAACAGLAVSLRAHGAPESEWAPMLEAAQRLAKRLKVPLPALPPLTGAADADRAAAHTWLSKTLPEAVLSRLDKSSGKLAGFGLKLSDLHLRYEKDGPDNDALEELAGEIADEWESNQGGLVQLALLSGLSGPDFRRTVVSLVNLMFDGSPNDPLSLELAERFAEVEADWLARDVFEGPVSTALAMALTDARNAPGWRLQLDIRQNRDDGNSEATAEVIIGGQSADITFSGFEQDPEHIIIIGKDSWVSSDGDKKWEKNAMTPATTAFRALLERIFKADQATGLWNLDSSNERPANDDGKPPVVSYDVIRATTADNKPSGALKYELTRHPSRGWILAGFLAAEAFGPVDKESASVRSAERHVEGKEQPAEGMVRLAQKPEIKPPAGAQ